MSQENKSSVPSHRRDLIWLALGSGLLVFTTWRLNVPLAAWLAPIFLMRFVRNQRRWYTALAVLPCMAAASIFTKWGAWPMEAGLQVATLTLAVLPLALALCVDRYGARKLTGLWGTLVFPATYVALDYAMTALPLGTVFSLAPTQYHVKGLLQLAAVTGLWGISFILTWLAPVANLLWEQGFDSRRARAAAGTYAACIALILLAGEARLVVARPAALTVRVAGITIAHQRNYVDEVVDLGTPTEAVNRLAPELSSLEDALFAESEKAAAAGARVIFWSEGAAVLSSDHRDSFTRRASAFAKRHGVYLVPAYQVLLDGQTTMDNGLLMISPDGEIAYRYTKTQSWYATASDGVLHSIETPFGRLATAICFDMDFPAFIRQVTGQGVDIMLVPAFDTLGTRPYHTEVGLMRSVELGFSVVRQTNEGTSMAVDYQGNLLATQDFFTTAQRTMVADVPTQGVATIYGVLGDFVPWLCLLTLVGLGVHAIVVKRR